jgi:hypothetical protein
MKYSPYFEQMNISMINFIDCEFRLFVGIA